MLCPQGLNDATPVASAIEESNALALAIVPSGKLPCSSFFCIFFMLHLFFVILFGVFNVSVCFFYQKILLQLQIMALLQLKNLIPMVGNLLWSQLRVMTFLLTLRGNW